MASFLGWLFFQLDQKNNFFFILAYAIFNHMIFIQEQQTLLIELTEIH